MNDGVVRDQVIAEMRAAGIISADTSRPIRVVDGREYVVLITVADLTDFKRESED